MLSVDYINQGEYDYLGAEISINGQIVCLIGIDDNLELFIEFFHDFRIIEQNHLKESFNDFLYILHSCKKDLTEVIESLQLLD